MSFLKRFFYHLFIVALLISPCVAFAGSSINIPVLCYHNLSPTNKNSMTMTPEKFESQIKWLKDNGFNIIPLKMAAEYLQGKRSSLPEKAIVITDDDGWESVYKYLYPIVKKYNIPVTLFIYPGAISEGKHTLSWDQVKELQQTGLFDIQGHTFTHPNFKQEKKHRSADNYAAFVQHELAGSKKALEDKLNTKILYLAWPFGIYDAYLESQAAKAGYEMAFTIDYRAANKTFRPMAQPRFMIIDAESEQTVHGIMNLAKPKPQKN